MRALVVLACVLLTGCAARLDAPQSACSDPLRLYTAAAYQPCCRTHDTDYLIGGTEADRLRADQRLYLCIAAMGSEDDAATMFYGVRLGGRTRFHYTK